MVRRIVSLILAGIVAGGLVLGGCASPAAERAARSAAWAAIEAGPAAERLAGVVDNLAADPPAGRLPVRLLLAWAGDLESQAQALRSAAGSLGGARAAGLSAADRAAGLAAGLRAAVAAGDAAALPALAADWSAACADLAGLIR